MNVTSSYELVVIPDLLCDTGCGLILIDVKAQFILSLSLPQTDLLKIFIFFIFLYLKIPRVFYK
jgi:hypothetical protein